MAHIAVEPQDVLAHALENPAVSASPDVARLIGIARTIAAMPNPEIDPAFVHRLEARLLTASFAGRTGTAPGRRLRIAPAASPVPVADSVPTNVVTLPRRRFVMRRSVVAAIAAAALMAMPIVASGSAIPGSPLYPVKRSIERLHLAFMRGPVGDGFLLLDHAQRRLDEVGQLVELGRTELVPATLDDMNRALREGTNLILRFGDTKALRRLAVALRAATSRISTLMESAPPGVQPALFQSLISGQALTREVDAALDGSGDLTPPALPAPQPPQNDLISVVSDGSEDLTSYFKMEQYYKKTPMPTPARGSDENESNETRSPCLATVYVGPGSGTLHSVCPTMTNMPGGGRNRPVREAVGRTIQSVPARDSIPRPAPSPSPEPEQDASAPQAPGPVSPAPESEDTDSTQATIGEAVSTPGRAPENQDEVAGTGNGNAGNVSGHKANGKGKAGHVTSRNDDDDDAQDGNRKKDD